MSQEDIEKALANLDETLANTDTAIVKQRGDHRVEFPDPEKLAKARQRLARLEKNPPDVSTI